MSSAVPPVDGTFAESDPLASHAFVLEPGHLEPIDGQADDGQATDAGPAEAESHVKASNSALFGRGLLYVLVSAIQLVTGALISPVLAHLLDDPAEFGRLSSAIALHQLLIVVAVVGLDQAVALKRAEDGHDGEVRALASAAVLLATAVTALLGITSRWWATLFGFEPASPLVLVTVLWTIPSAGVMVVLGLLLASDRLRAYSLVSVLAVVGGQVTGVLLIVLNGPRAQTYAWGLVAADTAAMLVGWVVTRPRLRGAFSATMLRPALLLGLPLMLGSLSSFVLNAGDRILVQRLLGAAEVGRYQIAYTIGFVAVQLIALTGSSWTPRFAGITDQVLRWRLIGRSRDSIYRVLSPVVLGVILAAPVLLRVVAPASYRPESLLVVVYLIVITAYPVAASGATGRMLITQRRARPLALWAGLAALANALLNLALVPALGIAGAAAATVLAYTVQCLGQRLAVGQRETWPRTPVALLVQSGVVVLVAGASTLLPQTTGWDVARFAMGLACLPWCWVQLQRARRS